MIAKYFGRSMTAKQTQGESEIIIDDGQVNLIDAGGVSRVVGRLNADAPKGSKLILTATFAHDEITILVSGKDANGKAINVRAELDMETGRPKGEKQPPHGAVRYQLYPEQEGKPLRVKMQWTYEWKKLRQANRGAR